jgi:uncharacterized SAM-binding protein YcdF (DUF218 family)
MTLAMKTAWRLTVRLLLTLLLSWLIFLALLDAYGQPDRAQPAGAIVILGSRVLPGGQPGPALTRRTRHAVALYQRGLAPLIICSGGLGHNAPTEAEAACALAAALGVPAQALLREDRAASTEENALYTAALARARGLTAVIVVSDGYHLYRADLLFRAAGLRPYVSPAQGTAGPMPLLERYGRLTREIAALGWYWGKGIVGYEGTDFP